MAKSISDQRSGTESGTDSGIPNESGLTDWSQSWDWIDHDPDSQRADDETNLRNWRAFLRSIANDRTSPSPDAADSTEGHYPDIVS